jgi:hypothetical protein
MNEEEQVREIVDIVDGYQELVKRFKSLNFAKAILKQYYEDCKNRVPHNEWKPIKVTDEQYGLVRTLFGTLNKKVRLYGYDLYWEDSQLDEDGRVKAGV